MLRSAGSRSIQLKTRLVYSSAGRWRAVVSFLAARWRPCQAGVQVGIVVLFERQSRLFLDAVRSYPSSANWL